MTLENLDFAAILIVAILVSCTLLTIIYLIYSLIKWYAKRNETLNYQKEIREYYMKPVQDKLWDNVGELN